MIVGRPSRGSRLGDGPEFERVLFELLASGGEGGDRCSVHSRAKGEMPGRAVGSLLVGGNTLPTKSLPFEAQPNLIISDVKARRIWGCVHK